MSARRVSATPLDTPLGGDLLIEASAGTGKTYALTTLAARAVVEAALPAERLLLVTFTVAATSELRHRLRDVLRTALAAVRRPAAADGSISASDDDQAADLAKRWRRLGIETEAEGRLTAAVRDLDRANILTIHGFCQRVLAEFAFDGAIPFGFEVSGDDALAVGAAARDFWRRRLVDAPSPLLAHARRTPYGHERFEPDALADWARLIHPKPDLDVRGAGERDVAARFSSAYDGWRKEFDALRGHWPRRGAAFMRTIDGLSFRRGSLGKARRLQRLLRAALDGDVPELLPLADAGYFGKSSLSRVTSKAQFPANPLFDAFDRLGDAAKEPNKLADAWLRRQRTELLDAVRTTLRESAWAERQLSFNGLLTETERALRGPAGEALAERIRDRYQMALIDEFQDTDGLQARIFERIYPIPSGQRRNAADAGSRRGADAAKAQASVVGDPKQSIYAFRGADLFAFLQIGKRKGQRRLVLEANFRSTPGLVQAVNALFARRHPFLLPEVSYEAVQAARAETSGLRFDDDLLLGDDGRPFVIRLDPTDGKGSGEDFQTISAASAAAEIARLLRLGETGRAAIDGQPLGGGDIAVLVRTSAQGQAMAEALRMCGVQSVELADVDVFETADAAQLHHLLYALCAAPEHRRAAALRGALAADMFGLTVQDLAALAEDRPWAAWQERFRDWRATWRSAGVATLIRRLLFAAPTQCGQALLQQRNGARRLTNMMHLADLLQQVEAREQLEPVALVDWLAARRRNLQRGNDATQLRLESDERLVKVATVHRSKGLEFPVVFYPFAWYRRRAAKGATAQYHERQGSRYVEVLDLDPSEDAYAQERAEDQAEELRLLYVALTRAKYRCVVTWARALGHERAALAWLLHGRDIVGDTPVASMKAHAAHMKQDAGAWRIEVEAFAAQHQEAIRLAGLFDPADAPPPQSPLAQEVPTAAQRSATDAKMLRARAFHRPLRAVRQATSYSALAAERGAAVSAAEHIEAARPDHDQREDAALAELSLDGPAQAAPAAALSAFAMPRGRRIGHCVHELFEFSVALEPHEEAVKELERLGEGVLRRHGIDLKWLPTVCSLVTNARGTPLVPDTPRQGQLRLVDFERPLVEMEFQLPVNSLRRDQLGACLKAHGYDDPFQPPDSKPRAVVAGMEEADAEAVLAPVDGFLSGFIDLVGEHDGRWYVVDYKSNWLGDDYQAYAPAALRVAMRRNAYHLQYLLYLTALHRHLRLRLPDYDCDRHLGGAFYLFVRGMRPQHPGHGVFHDAPPRACIEAIDACLGDFGTRGSAS